MGGRTYTTPTPHTHTRGILPLGGEEYQEVFADKLTTKQQTDGYVAWTEQIHLHLFYQRIVEDKDMKIKPAGRYITPLRRAAIRKAGPLVAP